ncbi:MAG: SIMPL domain-containing protein [Lachnospiraceae bacterium]|nr:SIMPL domain-containing protein [Lachnospiraceae bacterium]
MGKIDVEGYAERMVDYDLMKISIDFHDKGRTSDSASVSVMQECEHYLEILKKTGIDISKIRLIKDSVNEYTRYMNDDEQDEFSATRKLELTAPFNMKMINTLRSIADGLKLQVDFNVSYVLSNETEIRKELLKEAVIAAKTRAEEIASSIDMSIKGLISADKKDHDLRETDGNVLCLYDSIDAVCECERFEYSETLMQSSITLTENIYTVWELK